MDEWLKNYGPGLGNALLSGVGLVFAIGAPVTDKFRLVKKWWVTLWAGLFGIHLGASIVSMTTTVRLRWFILLSICNGISTMATAMLWLQLRDKQPPSNRILIIISCLIFLPAMLSAYLYYSPYSLTTFYFFGGLISRLLDWVFFMLLAWCYRKRHMSTTILLLAYANLQLPAGLIGKEGWNNDLLLLLAAKLSLIGAMYKTLGVRDAPA